MKRSFRVKQSDFAFDSDRFQGALGKNNRLLAVTRQHLLNTISHWPGFTQSMLGGNASIVIDEQTKNISGVVLGKSFTINFGVLATDEFCRVEAIIFSPSTQANRDIEVGRFYLGSDGAVFSADNEVLMNDREDFQSYSLLTAVLRKVLSTPQTA